MLGLPPSASAGEIRAAWRRTAIATHPDRNPGDPTAERRFKAAAAAYEILGDPRRRAAWDARYPGVPQPPPRDARPQEEQPREPSRREAPRGTRAAARTPARPPPADLQLEQLLMGLGLVSAALVFWLCGYGGGAKAFVLLALMTSIYVLDRTTDLRSNLLDRWQLIILLVGLGGAIVGWL